MAHKTDVKKEYEDAEVAFQDAETEEPTKEMHIAAIQPGGAVQPGGADRRSTPSAPMKGLSQALMAGAFEKFGQAFTRTGDVARDRASEKGRMQPWREAGATVSDALEQRWWRMEYENFQAEFVDTYVQQKKGILSEYTDLHAMLDNGQYPDAHNEIQQFDLSTPEGRKSARLARTQLFKKFWATNADMDMELANQAYKYTTNPIIDKRIEAIITAGSKQLMNIAAPKEQLNAEQTQAQMDMAERNADINQQMANAQTSRAKTEAKLSQTPREALADPNIGVEGILQWLEHGRGQQWLASPAAQVYHDQGKAVLTEQLHLRNEKEAEADGKKYDRLDPDNMAMVEAEVQRNGGAVQRATAVALLAAIDPKAAKEARKYAPQFYDLIPEEGLPGGPPVKAKRSVPSKRLTPSQKRANVNKWRGPLTDKLKEYMADLGNETDIEAALEHILEEWLPQALRGDVNSTAPTSILSSGEDNMLEYEKQVMEASRKWLIKSWPRLSVMARETNPEAARKITPIQPGRKRGMGIIDKGLKALFD